MPTVPTWLKDRSVESLVHELARVAPDFVGGKVVLHPWIEQSDPKWWSGSATIDERFIVKFAWSELAAQRLWHEIRILDALAPERTSLRIPRVLFRSDDPVILVTELVTGEPLTSEAVMRCRSQHVDRTAMELARFLSKLHEPWVLSIVDGALDPLPAPMPQATTDELRRGIAQWIRTDQLETVRTWCDWVDRVQGVPGGRVFVHGDLHGYNQVWDLDENILRVVVDFEHGGAHEPEFDFRYLPSQGTGMGLLRATVAKYEALSGRTLNLTRVMAWHVRTMLGDALWRSRAGVTLPDGGSPEAWVEELRRRLDALDEEIGWDGA
jgi:hypothetical protein